jgi:hypothetical protein
LTFNPPPRHANSWVVRYSVFGYCPSEHCTQRIEKIALREWRVAFLVDHLLHMRPGQQQRSLTGLICSIDPLVAVQLAQVFQDVSLRSLRFGSEGLERGTRSCSAVKIRRDKGSQCPGHALLLADRVQ